MKNRELIERCTMCQDCCYCEQDDECDLFMERNFITPEDAGMLIKNKVVFDEEWLESEVMESEKS